MNRDLARQHCKDEKVFGLKTKIVAEVGSDVKMNTSG